MNKLEIPQFKTRKELFAFLIENKDTLIYQKKSQIKYADGIGFSNMFYSEKSGAYKSNIPVSSDKPELKVRAIINTTNIMDSHKDVHLPGIWDKSLKENRMIKHLQEHIMQYDKIISDKKDLKAYTAIYSFKELGFDLPGTTQALIFDSTIRKTRNPFMFKQYADGNVDNHSVGMIYVRVDLAMDDEDNPKEKKLYDEYINSIANKEEVEAQGFFFPVREAKVIEGSAVPLGSNYVTPTLDNNMKSSAVIDTEGNEPPSGTRKIDINKLINELKKI
jgi:hypothetical protein